MYVIDKKTNHYLYVPDAMYDPAQHSQVTDQGVLSQLEQKRSQATTVPQPKPEVTTGDDPLRKLLFTSLMGKARTPSEAATIYTTFGKPVADDQTAEQAKKEDAKNSIINFIDTLEGHYAAGGGGSFGSGPGARVKGIKTNIGGALGLNDEANIYNRQKKGFVATIKELTGDTGVLTEQDAQRLLGLLPDFGSTPEESRALLQDLRNQVAAKFGREPSKSSFAPIKTETKGNALNLVDAFFPKTVGAVENYQEAPPDPYETVTQGLPPPLAAALNTKYRENVPGAGEELLNAILLGQGARNIAKGAVPLFTSKRAAGEAISKAGQEASGMVDGNKILAEIKKVYDAATPGERRQMAQMVKDATSLYRNKQIPVEVANRTLTMAGDAYTAAGGIGNSAKAAIEAATARGIRGQLPEALMEARRAYGVAAGRDKFLNRMIFPAAVGSGAAIGTGALLRMLGIGGPPAQ